MTGFGHSYDVHGGLRRNMAMSMAESGWNVPRDSTSDTKVALIFNDEMDDKGKRLPQCRAHPASVGEFDVLDAGRAQAAGVDGAK